MPREDAALAAASAILFWDKVSPALEQVGSSSGAVGIAVNHAIEACATTIVSAPVDDRTRDQMTAVNIVRYAARSDVGRRTKTRRFARPGNAVRKRTLPFGLP